MDPRLNARCAVPAAGLANVVVSSEPIPQPARGEARVRIEAAGVSYTDVAIINGTFRRRFPFPLVPGYDCVGRIESFGEAAEAAAGALRIGDRVAALTQVGGMQQYACVDVRELVRVPDACDPAEAVAVVLNYTLAYCLLHRGAAGHVRPGGTILVHSAAGGVGTALVHLALLEGVAHVYGTCSAGKMAHVARQGAVPIDYKHEDFVARTIELTGGRKVDAVFDAIGGAHVQRSFGCLAHGGRLVCYGFTAADSQEGGGSGWDAFTTHAAIAAFQARFWSSRSAVFFDIDKEKAAHPDDFRNDLSTVMRLLGEGRLHPIVHSRLALADAATALREVARREHVGKVVIICDDALVAAEERRGRLQTATSLLQHPPDIRIPGD